MYSLLDAGVSISVNVRTGRIFRLAAGESYAGALFGAIRPGMRVQDALPLDPRLHVDEAEKGLVWAGVPGVFLDAEPPSSRSTDMLDGAIWWISVFSDLSAVDGRKAAY